MVAVLQEGSSKNIFDFEVLPNVRSVAFYGIDLPPTDKQTSEPEQPVNPSQPLCNASFIEIYSVCGLEIFYVQFYKMFCMRTQHRGHCISRSKAIPPPCVLVKKY